MDATATRRRRIPLLVPSLVAVLAGAVFIAFAWASGNLAGRFTSGPISPSATFTSEAASFAYPSTWTVISRGESCARHGDEIRVAVGTGFVSIPRRERVFAAGTELTCFPLSWIVAPDRIVVAYIRTNFPSPRMNGPSALEPGERHVLVDGRPAGYSETPTSRTWRFLDERDRIEVHWGADLPDGERTHVDELVAGWTWAPR